MTELLYFDDPYEKEFEARVTSVDSDSGSIVLDQTAFYPKGGNQDWDTGVLEIGQMKFPVIEVTREKGQEAVTHTIAEELRAQLLEVSSGDAVRGEIDWDRRYLHMKIHTAQHFLSALLLKLGFNTVACDISVSGGMIKLSSKPSLDQLSSIQSEANESISSGLETQHQLEGDDRYHMHIGEVDDRECGGTHLKDLSEIGSISIVKVDANKIYFKVGAEAVNSSNALEEIKKSLAAEADQENEAAVAKQLALESLQTQLQKEVLIKGVSVRFVHSTLKVKPVMKVGKDTLKNGPAIVLALCARGTVLILSNIPEFPASDFFKACTGEQQDLRGEGSAGQAQGGSWEGSFEDLKRIAKDVLS